jgi:aspartate 1-decarboxylase
MKLADLWPYERVEVYNIDNGARFATYVIEGRAGSGTICVNGAAAHMVKPGHKVIIACYATMAEEQVVKYERRIITVDERNRHKPN